MNKYYKKIEDYADQINISFTYSVATRREVFEFHVINVDDSYDKSVTMHLGERDYVIDIGQEFGENIDKEKSFKKHIYNDYFKSDNLEEDYEKVLIALCKSIYSIKA